MEITVERVMALLTEAGDLRTDGQLSGVADRMEQAAALLRGHPFLKITFLEPLLARLGVVYENLGRIDRAAEVLQEALALSMREPDCTSRMTMQIRISLASLHLAAGDAERARADLLAVLETLQTAFPSERREIARTLNNLWAAARALGRHDEANQYLLRAYQMLRVRVDADDQLLATLLLNLGVSRRDASELGAARHYFALCRARAKNAFAAQSQEYATLCIEESCLLSAMLEHAKAVEVASEALRIRHAILGSASAAVADACMTVGLFATEAGDHAPALRNFQAAYQVYAMAPDGGQALAMTALFPMVTAAWKAGQIDDAEYNARMLIEVLRGRAAADDPHLFRLLADLAAVLAARGDVAGMAPVADEAAQVFSGLDRRHDDSLRSHFDDLASLALQADRGRFAMALMLRAAATDDKLIVPLVASRDESLRRVFARTLALRTSALVRLALATMPLEAATARGVYEVVASRKGLLAVASMAHDDAVLGRRQPELGLLLGEIAELRRQIAELDASGTMAQEVLRDLADRHKAEEPQPDHPLARLAAVMRQLAEAVDDGRDDPRPRLVERLRGRGDEVEALLHPEYRPSVDARVDVAALAAWLPAGSALVDYYALRTGAGELEGATAEAERLGMDHVIDPSRLADRYVAFVLPAGAPDEVRLVDLGSGEEVAREVFSYLLAMNPGQVDLVPGEWRGSILRGSEEELSAVVRRRLFDPVVEHLGTTRTVLIVPDGVVARIPFGVLVAAHDPGARLIDEYTFSYLTSARAAFHFRAESFEPVSAPLVVGDPDYDLAPGRAERDPVGSEEHPGLHFPRLPASRDEAQGVARLLGGQLRLGRAANEAAVLGCRSPYVLHLATHGYFVRPFSRNLIVVGGWRTEQVGPWLRREILGAAENPFERTGLALAGVNAWSEGRPVPEGVGDGLLSAREVAHLELRGTELVVLSACSSALGDVGVGQGTAGLLHAFHAAGARSIVAALWEIPDEASAMLVREFYDALARGVSRAEALRGAQLALRREGKDAWMWGGMICCGEPGPMSRELRGQVS